MCLCESETANGLTVLLCFDVHVDKGTTLNLRMYSRTSIIRTPLATGVRVRVRIIEIVRTTKINTVPFEHIRKLMIFILYNYIHGKFIIFTIYRNSI